MEPGPVGSIPEPRPPIEGSVDGEVTVTGADVRIMESFPVQIALDVTGEKPTPCHEIFWTVEDDGEVIVIEMISQVAAEQTCAQVIEPFTIAVPLGSWTEESRDIELNGEIVGSFEHLSTETVKGGPPCGETLPSGDFRDRCQAHFDLQAKCRRGEPPATIPVSVALSPSALLNFILIRRQLQNPFRFTHGD